MAALFILLPAASLASTPGQPICTEAGSHEMPTVAADGQGGGFVAWSDTRSGTYRLYVQRVEANASAPAWTPGGVPVGAPEGGMFEPLAVADGAGGCILVWGLGYSPAPGLYAQRFDPVGTPLWTAAGQPVCTAAGGQGFYDVAADRQGGVIIAWEDRRYAGVAAIFAQRLDATGTPLWTVDGVELAPFRQGTRQRTPRVLPDGFGGAMIVWSGDPGGGDYNIVVQRITDTGQRLFSLFGQEICTAPGDQTNPRLDHDGWNQIVVVWSDDRSGGLETYANNIDWGANRWWSEGGIALGAAHTDRPQVIGDGIGGAVVSWVGPAPGYGLLVSRLNPIGMTLWTTDVGGPVFNNSYYRDYHRIVSDGAGGAIVAWVDYDSGSLYGVRAQRLDTAGTTLWPSEGVALRQAQGGFFEGVRLAADGTGGALGVWQELIDSAGIWHVYGQGVAADGTLSLPAPAIASVRDVPRDQGGKLQVQWHRASWDRPPYDRITHYSVWRRFGAGARGKVEDQWEWLASVPAIHMDRYAATVPSLADSQGVDPIWQTFRVVSHTAAAGEFYPCAPDSGYSVDNLAPAVPTGLQAESRPGGGLALAWLPVEDLDFHHFEVHRGDDAGFLPAVSTLLAVTTAPAAEDPSWRPGTACWYKVAAVDAHGNFGGFAVLDSGGVPGGGTPPLPEMFFLSDARPNPFNPATRIAFGLDAPTLVRLSVHDAAGRLVKVLAEGQLTPGRYEVDWHGDDATDRAMPSGVYLCRLVAGPRTETRKLTLLR